MEEWRSNDESSEDESADACPGLALDDRVVHAAGDRRADANASLEPGEPEGEVSRWKPRRPTQRRSAPLNSAETARKRRRSGRRANPIMASPNPRSNRRRSRSAAETGGPINFDHVRMSQ